MKDLYIFIIWSKARWCEKWIVDDISKSFNMICNVNIHWNKDVFETNLESFYGVKLPVNSDKMQHCGNGNFKLIIVEDKKPNFQWRNTSSGEEYVNANMFDKKTLYREWTGGGHRIHCSNTFKETRHDLAILTGYDVALLSRQEIQNKLNFSRERRFQTTTDFERFLNAISDNIYYRLSEDNYLILADCRENVTRAAKMTKKDFYNRATIKIADKEVQVCILGVKEGELPEELYEKCLQSDTKVRDFIIKKHETYLEEFEKGGFSDPEVIAIQEYIGNNFSTNRVSTVKCLKKRGVIRRLYLFLIEIKNRIICGIKIRWSR